jgi:transketolase
VFTRQAVPHLDRAKAKDPGVARGAYVLADADSGTPDVILIGTGSEVQLCVQAREKLNAYGVKARVVSMPSWEIFAAQDESYRESVLPKRIKARVTVEAGATLGWHRWAGDEGIVIGVERFGASAPGEEVLQHLGFTPEHVTSAALRVVGRKAEADREYSDDTSLVHA